MVAFVSATWVVLAKTNFRVLEEVSEPALAAALPRRGNFLLAWPAPVLRFLKAVLVSESLETVGDLARSKLEAKLHKRRLPCTIARKSRLN